MDRPHACKRGELGEESLDIRRHPVAKTKEAGKKPVCTNLTLTRPPLPHLMMYANSQIEAHTQLTTHRNTYIEASTVIG
jgi:hypothetical protein